MKLDNKYKAPIDFLQLEVVEYLDFQDIPSLALEKDPAGTLYLSYLVEINNYTELRTLISVSEIRLKEILSGHISLNDAFNIAESEFVYFISFKLTNGVQSEVLIYPLFEFITINPIPEDYLIPITFNEIEPILENQELISYAVKKNKIILDFYLKSDQLNNNIKPWAVNKVFQPVVEMTKSFLEIDQRQADHLLAYSNLRQSSLGISIEITHHPTIFEESKEIGQIRKVIYLLNAQSKEDLQKIINSSKNEAYLKHYVNVINTIIEKNATLCTAIADPISRTIIESKLNRKSANIIKIIIDETLQNITDIEEYIGYFLEIDVDKKEPSFKFHSIDEDVTIKGKIAEDVLEKLKADMINIGKENYSFTIKTIYKPETTVNPEKTVHYLLEYKRVDEKH